MLLEKQKNGAEYLTNSIETPPALRVQNRAIYIFEYAVPLGSCQGKLLMNGQAALGKFKTFEIEASKYSISNGLVM